MNCVLAWQTPSAGGAAAASENVSGAALESKLAAQLQPQLPQQEAKYVGRYASAEDFVSAVK
jgi:hypothetical protein